MIQQRDWPALFGPKEWAWIQKLGSALHDPEEKSAFWNTIKEKKLKNPRYSPFDDFPAEPIVPIVETPTERARRECIEAVRARRKITPMNTEQG